MNIRLIKYYALTLILGIICFEGSSQSQKPSNGKDFSVSFADEIWNGNIVPEGQQCQRFGGIKPSTPRLNIVNIPKGSTAIIMEYCDKDYEPMDNGGHGMVGYKLPKGKKNVTIPSVPGHTNVLPDGFWVVAEHKAPGWDTAGAYLPPCSGGKGHNYAVTVKAVKQLEEGNGKMEILAQFTLNLGKF